MYCYNNKILLCGLIIYAIIYKTNKYVSQMFLLTC